MRRIWLAGAFAKHALEAFGQGAFGGRRVPGGALVLRSSAGAEPEAAVRLAAPRVRHRLRVGARLLIRTSDEGLQVEPRAVAVGLRHALVARGRESIRAGARRGSGRAGGRWSRRRSGRNVARRRRVIAGRRRGIAGRRPVGADGGARRWGIGAVARGESHEPGDAEEPTNVHDAIVSGASARLARGRTSEDDRPSGPRPLGSQGGRIDLIRAAGGRTRPIACREILAMSSAIVAVHRLQWELSCARSCSPVASPSSPASASSLAPRPPAAFRRRTRRP